MCQRQKLRFETNDAPKGVGRSSNAVMNEEFGMLGARACVDAVSWIAAGRED